MLHDAAFRSESGLSAKTKEVFTETILFGIYNRDPSIYTIDHPVSNFMENILALKGLTTLHRFLY